MSPRTATLLLAVAFVLAAAAFGCQLAVRPRRRRWRSWSAARDLGEGRVPPPAAGAGAGPVEHHRGGELPARARESPRRACCPGSSIEHPLADQTSPDRSPTLRPPPARAAHPAAGPPPARAAGPVRLRPASACSAGGSAPASRSRCSSCRESSPSSPRGRRRPRSAARDGRAAARAPPGSIRARSSSRSRASAPTARGRPASRIHWPTVARSGELAERRLVSGGESPPLVVLDAFEPRVRGGARPRGAGGRVDLRPPRRRRRLLLLLPGASHPLRIGARMRGWRQAHARLALVEPCRRPPAGSTLRAARTTFLVSAAASPKRPA